MLLIIRNINNIIIRGDDKNGKKLTPNIDEKTIEETKKYARKKQKSLSRIVQDYLKFIVKLNTNEGSSVNKDIEIELSPTVKRLLGSVKIDKEKLEKISDEKKE